MGVYVLGFVLVVFFSITAAVVDLGLTGDLPYYATSVLVQSKTRPCSKSWQSENIHS